MRLVTKCTKKLLKKIRKNDDVKAVVLRINSPGGSALVSDKILREVKRTQETKPVVVSFGDVAASGGYYIAASANKIVAEATTITGSIGVFGAIPNAHELMTDWGINSEQVSTNKNAFEYSVFEPMSESYRERMQDQIGEVYETFVNHVVEGRNMTFEEVDAVGGGRVWSGLEAKEAGLVDEIGGVDRAIEIAAELAGVESFGLKKYPKYKSAFEAALEDLKGAKVDLVNDAIREELGEDLYIRLQQVRKIQNMQGVQARVPYLMHIE